MKYPLLSVITVTYNCETLIEPTIASVRTQKYDDIEHIIVDGMSTDDTVDIVKSNINDISAFISEEDQGIYDAMNKGIGMVSNHSKYICFMNAGDTFFDENVVRDMIERSRSNTSHLYGRVSKAGRITSIPRKLNKYMLSTNMVCHQAIFFQTEVHRTNLYDTRFRICADYKLLLQLVTSGEEFEAIDRIVAVVDDTGISNTERNRLRAEKERIRASYPDVYWIAKIRLAAKRIRAKINKPERKY